MSDNVVYLARQGSTQYETLLEFRASFYECVKVWEAYRDQIGAVDMYSFGVESPNAFGFRGEVPNGWRKKNSRGISTPFVKNKHAIAEIKALPTPGDWFELCESFGFPSVMSSENRSKRVGCPLRGFQFVWINEHLGLWGPDFQKMIEIERVEHPDAVFNKGKISGDMPDGFEKITKARWELINAQVRVEKEEAAS